MVGPCLGCSMARNVGIAPSQVLTPSRADSAGSVSKQVLAEGKPNSAGSMASKVVVKTVGFMLICGKLDGEYSSK